MEEVRGMAINLHIEENGFSVEIIDHETTRVCESPGGALVRPQIPKQAPAEARHSLADAGDGSDDLIPLRGTEQNDKRRKGDPDLTFGNLPPDQ